MNKREQKRLEDLTRRANEFKASLSSICENCGEDIPVDQPHSCKSLGGVYIRFEWTQQAILEAVMTPRERALYARRNRNVGPQRAHDVPVDVIRIADS